MPTDSAPGTAITVLGPCPSDMLGVTLLHEHVFIDLSVWLTPPASEKERTVAALPVTPRTMSQVRRDPFAVLDNLYLNDEDLASSELALFAAAGGRTIVDLTLPYIGRDPARLRRIAKRTGLTVIMGCGHYIHYAHPPWLALEDEERIAVRLIGELSGGVPTLDGEPVRAGVIGEIGTSDPITGRERVVLRAAAMAQRETGAPMIIHLDPWGHAGHQALDIAEAAGADLTRVVLCHLDPTLPDLAYHRSLVSRGATISYDIWGDEDGYGGKGMPADTARIDALETAVAEGWIGHVAIAHDICTKSQLSMHGGPGYAHILTRIVPALRARGHGPELVRLLLEGTPRRLLAWKAFPSGL
jgi:phosphotriesterase-related protein